MKNKQSNLMKLTTVVIMIALLIMTSGGVFAADTTLTSTTALTGSQSLDRVTISGQDLGDLTATMTIDTKVTWQQPAQISTTYDPNQVRQGRPLDPSVTYANTSPGMLYMTWTLGGMELEWDIFDELINGDKEISASAPCPILTDGVGFPGTMTSSEFYILDYTALSTPGTPYAKMFMVTSYTIAPEGIDTTRQAVFGGIEDGTSDLSLHLDPITDPLYVPCTVGAGSELSYNLGELSTSPAIEVNTFMVIKAGSLASVGGGEVDFVTIIFYFDPDTKEIVMTGPGASFNLGEVLPNNVPPTAVTADLYEGKEGSPIAFDGSLSTSVCGAMPTLRWDFSDGGVAYGAKPEHTFQGPGIFSGLLTATDMTGLTATRTFSVKVIDLPPVANAGPNMSTKWGIPVTLNGSALNPGTDQQPYLTYWWVFGDGTPPPSASGGAVVTHVYDQPGDYIATLTAIDPGGYSHDNETHVVVEKRATILGYIGPLTSSSSQTVPLKAILKDEFGNPLEGRSVVFTFGTQSSVTAMTDSTGVATCDLKLRLKAGTYQINVVFAPVPGSTDIIKYNGSSTSAIFKIGKK